MSHGDGASTPQRRLEEVISRYLRAVELGMPVDRSELLVRHPDLDKHLRAFFAAQDQSMTVRGASGCEDPTLPGKAVHDATLPAGSKSSGEQRDSAVNDQQATIPPSHDMTEAASGQQASPRDGSPHRPRRLFGGYELLEKIAQGGMGVVWKARHVKLNRIVALKMILAGQLASDDDVRRFHTEAEVAAHLDHPGIVPVYEVGEHDGQHYFSMSFVEGQSLAAKLAGGPLPPREAAELLKKVAQAIAYAHQRGVIHRDLKPGNILLDHHGEPHVTDFGLGKRVPVAGESATTQTPATTDRALTMTGQVLGTPGYMPPEQAAGKISEIGPLADVYALGAILYALLTGNPPFQGSSVLETLMAVLEQKPTPPRQLRAGLPTDLNTICLKCLEKEPSHRYGSALDLAEDLLRYLEGKPILARPMATVERLAKWMARNRGKALRYVVMPLVMVWMTVVSGAAVWINSAKKDADQQRDLARRNEAEAKEQKGIADARKKEAEDNLALATKNEADAIEQKGLAEKNLEEAKRQEAEAKKQTDIAEKNLKESQRQEKLAKASADEAKKQTEIAKINEAKATEATGIAESNLKEAKRQEVEALKQKGIAESRTKEAEDARAREEMANKALLVVKNVKKQAEEAREMEAKAKVHSQQAMLRLGTELAVAQKQIANTYGDMVRDKPDQSSLWYLLGLAQLAHGDVATYRATSRTMMSRFGDSKDLGKINQHREASHGRTTATEGCRAGA